MKEPKELEGWKGDKKDILTSMDLNAQLHLPSTNIRKAGDESQPSPYSTLKTQKPFKHVSQFSLSFIMIFDK